MLSKVISRYKPKINKLFIKILLYFLSLTVPIFVLGTALYIKSIKELKQEFSNRVTLNLESSAETIDFYLRAAQDTSASFFRDDIIINHFKPRNQMTLIDRVQTPKIPRILARYKTVVGNFVESIYVYVDQDNIYTCDGLEYFDDFFNKFYRYKYYDMEFWLNKLDSKKAIEILPPTKVSKSLTGNDVFVVPVVRTEWINGNRAVMVINISANMIYRTIRNSSIISATDFVILDQYGNIVAESGGNRYSNSVDDIISQFGGEEKQYKEIKVNGKNCLITYVRSEVYGWTYLSITPLSEFSKRSNSILLLTLTSCLTLAGIGVCFSFIFTRRIYNPIRQIRDIILDSEIHPVNGDDFDLIGTGINRLIQREDQFKRKSLTLSKEYCENSLVYLINGNKIESTDILEMILKQNFGFTKDKYLCCNILIEFKQDFYNEMKDADRINVLDGLKKVIWALFEQYVNAYTIDYMENLFTCIININSNELHKVKKAAQSIIKCFEYDSKYCSIYIGIGNSCDEINEIYKSYNEAITAIAHTSKESDFQIVFADELNIVNSISYTLADENKIFNCLSTANIDALRDIVCDLIQTNIDRGNSHESIIMLFRNLFITGIRFLAERGIDINPFVSQYDEQILRKDVSSYLNYSERLKALIRFYNRIIDQVLANESGDSYDLAQLIAEYVNENYDEDLYLEKIADEMGVSVKYVSRVFKEKMGINLTDYINSVRVEKVKELLVETDMLIRDIGPKVGIYSRTTFVRTFKKVVGITPSEYRQLHRKTSS